MIKGNDYGIDMLETLLGVIERSDKIPSISTSMHIELNHIPFHLHSHERKIIISFDKWSQAISFHKMMRDYQLVRKDDVGKIKKILDKINLTFCLQNKNLPFIGPQSSSILSQLSLLFLRLLTNKRN